MGVAQLAAKRSKDPSTQVGACIVNSNNLIVGVGYNGMPRGCDDDEMPWERDGEELDTKYPYVCHSELNAILNSMVPLRDENARIYVTLFPCNECAKAIIQSGIKEIIYACDKYSDTPSVRASKKMFNMVGITYRSFNSPIEISRSNDPIRIRKR